MAFWSWFSMALLLCVALPAKAADIPEGVHRMECRDRYFIVAIDLSFAGEKPRFEAVAAKGVHPITKHYSAKCGYTILHLPGQVELRASYLSCHTKNKDDAFTFSFNLITNHGGEEVTYALKKSCSPSLAWAPREVTCETNYMEVSVRSEVVHPSGEISDWNAAKPASAASDWQVIFHRDKEPLKPMNLSEALKHGYVFDLTDSRLVFRTPYEQPDSSTIEVNGVPVEVVHATLFSRQSWVVLMVDLVAACSMHEGSYHNSGYMVWETPESLHPPESGLTNMQVSVGVGGELVTPEVAEERGYVVDQHNKSVEISMPYTAEGGYRKSFVSDGLYEIYIFNLYLEQLFEDEDLTETRVRYHRTLATPMLRSRLFTVNCTALEDHMFTIYLGDVTDDIELTAVDLNGHTFASPFTNASGHTITKVVHPNNTHGYTLRVPFSDPVVKHQFSREEEVMKHVLKINFTLTVLPENELYFHLTSAMAESAVSPPEFDAVCSESGISFELDHRPYNYLWHISIGPDLLTPELATQHGYILTNDSESLMLEVPLFTHGYEYKNFSLKGFIGTFEILVKDHESSVVLSSAVKTCPFTATELIVCSTDGRMTVMADLSLAIPSGMNPTRSNLLDTYCGPKEADDTRALFSFPLNSCGSIVKLKKDSVTYQNEIFYSNQDLSESTVDSEPDTERLIVQCSYPLAGLHRLFSVYKFESDSAGFGEIIHTSQSTTEIPPTTTTRPTTALRTTPAAKRTTRAMAAFQPAFHPTARYIRVYPFQNFRELIKGGKGAPQTKP